MKFELNEKEKELDKLFRNYHKQFCECERDPEFYYSIHGGSGIGLNLYIHCKNCNKVGDITDYTTW